MLTQQDARLIQEVIILGDPRRQHGDCRSGLTDQGPCVVNGHGEKYSNAA